VVGSTQPTAHEVTWRRKNKLKPIIVAYKGRTARIAFHPALGRVDCIVSNEIIDATNIANPDFKCAKGNTLVEKLEGWGRDRLKQYRVCDLCGEETYAPPLADYDIEEFPDLRGKVVCRSCRAARYNESISRLLREEKESWLSLFPNKGPVKVVDINLCLLPSCNCGWNLTLKVDDRSALEGLAMQEANILELKDNTVKIGGSASQWMLLARICQLAGGKLPDGYPPKSISSGG